jgi:hypothetical protein
MIGLLLAAVVALFFIQGPSGEPFLTLESFRTDFTLPATVSDLFGEDSDTNQSQVTRVYKWQDENGDWQFSNRAEDANGAEVIELDGVINSMGPLRAVEKSAPITAAPDETSAPPSLTTIPISKAMDTLDKARQMQETIDSRKTEVDKVLETN